MAETPRAINPVAPSLVDTDMPKPLVVMSKIIEPGDTADAHDALTYTANSPDATVTATATFSESTATESPGTKPTATAKNEPSAESVTTATHPPEIEAVISEPQSVEQPTNPTSTTARPDTEVNVTREVEPLAKAEMDKMFQEASSLLLELKDFRVYLTSLAQNLGDTPLAGEFRHNVLTMIKNLPAGEVPKEMAVRLKALQDKIPAGYASKRSTELLNFLTTNQKDFPNLITDKLMVAVADGKVNDEQVVLSITSDNTTVLGDRMREEMGINETQLQTAMRNLAEATGKPGWKDRWEAFMMKHPKLKPHLPSWAEFRAKAPGYLMMFGMALMMLNSFMDEGGSRQGH